ncbi:hypothetical protein QQ020_03085 [Fulvivirgaceae bacterium BMA12]|uniref:MG2 domain-containing protein n=1 Tax=Agaribacillus aureus TaxID=3051825 RepID=A0ABT8L2G7_9BACT|nr:hypothetical protein [Fulvivirgaceae bacterium BMA12]
MRTIVLILTLLASGNLYLLAQSDFDNLDTLKNRFEDQVTFTHQEKVFLDTDRSLYITGETIWISGYCTDASVHIPTDLSKVLNVELLDAEGQSIKQERIQLAHGFGKGQMFVSPDIKSGHYVLRAFTNWMKNFDPGFVFQKKLSIINPSVTNNQEVTEKPRITTRVDFFPEGGDMINGLTGKVAVRATDNFGRGVKLTGVVYDNDDLEVAKFSTSPQGYASFWLLPEQGKTYFARVAEGLEIKKYNLPAAKNTGVGMSVTGAGGDFKLTINTVENSPKPLYLIVHTRGVIQQILPLSMDSRKNLTVPLKNLSSGITHITLLDASFNPQCERLVFKYPENREFIKLDPGKPGYAKREKVRLNLSRTDTGTEETMARLSVSVYRSDELIPQKDNIIADLLCASDIRGMVSGLPALFDHENSSRTQEMDLVMLTHGWRRFRWADIKDGHKIKIKYPAEINGPILSGALQDMERFPVAIQISFHGKTSILNSLDIDPNGIFHFEVPTRVANDKVHFFDMRESLEPQHIRIDKPFNLGFETNLYPQLNFEEEMKPFLESLNTNIQLSQVYRDHNYINGVLPKTEVINTQFYGEPDFLYPLDDYTRFETVRDLFIEYIRSAVIRRKNKKLGFYVINEDPLPRSALMLIDGIPVLDPQFILDFDPLKVEKIGIINDRYYMGGAAFYGLINFTTYNGDFGGQEFPSYMIEKAYQGLQKSRTFYAPNYSSHQKLLKRIPDYRNTLYWNPDVRVEGDKAVTLEFYTADDNGTYQIEINGITQSGQLIHISKEIKVSEELP